MIFEFDQGIPSGSTIWLIDNVPPDKWEIRHVTRVGKDWIPCVIIDDNQLALMFALLWAGQ